MKDPPEFLRGKASFQRKKKANRKVSFFVEP
jgi:hypothetical protein